MRACKTRGSCRSGSSPCRIPSKPSRRLSAKFSSSSETYRERNEVAELHLFYNRPTSGAGYEPVSQRLLPLDETWRRKLMEIPWPTKNLPEVIGSGAADITRSHSRISLRLDLPRLRRIPRERKRQPPRRDAARRQEHRRTTGQISTALSTDCAKAASTKNSSTWSPASTRWRIHPSPRRGGKRNESVPSSRAQHLQNHLACSLSEPGPDDLSSPARRF